MNCTQCGAGLPPKTGVCPFCKTLNDIDLRGLFRVQTRMRDHRRACPRCSQPLDVLDLGLGQTFEVDRCDRCLGMFFDPGELLTVLGATVEEPGAIDYERLQKILDEELPDDVEAAKYIQCPVCNQLMNRRSQGLRSGVIVDECRDHGVWLDGGELRRIMLWVKAGGLKHAQQVQCEQVRRDTKKAKLQRVLDGAPVRNVDSETENVLTGATFVALLMRLLMNVWR